MAFRKKLDIILQYQPDILVIPECEHTDKIDFKSKMCSPTGKLWFGNNTNKGLGIFSFGKFKLKLDKSYNPDFQIIIPVSVTNGNISFTLFAIWANNPNDKDGRYIEQIWKAIHYYEKLLKKRLVILIGDFNSNTIWDRKRRESNHSNVVALLNKTGILSSYHIYHKQEQGSEKHPTLYMYRHKDKPYHIDYCFASKYLIDKLESVEIGEYHNWMQYSDHVPVITTFNTTVSSEPN